MSEEENRLQSSPQLVFNEQQEGVAVVLSEKETIALYKKSKQSGYSFDTLQEVYRRGYLSWDLYMNESPEQTAFNRVNSFIAEGAAAAMDSDLINEKRGLWDNIHAKRKRIKAGSGEKMRKPGSKGAPTDAAIKASQTEESDPCWKGYKQVGTKIKKGRSVPNCVPEETMDEAFSDKYMEKGREYLKLKRAKEKAIKKPATKMSQTDSDELVKQYLAKGGKVTKEEKYTGAEKTSKNMKDPASRFIGTDELTNTYKNMTPGQKIKKIVKEVIEENLYEMHSCGCKKCGEIEEKWSDAKHKSPSGGLTRSGVMAYRRENPGSKLQTAVTTKPSKLKKGSKAAKRRKSFCARMGGMKKRLTSAKTARDPDSRINKALRKWNC